MDVRALPTVISIPIHDVNEPALLPGSLHRRLNEHHYNATQNRGVKLATTSAKVRMRASDVSFALTWVLSTANIVSCYACEWRMA